MSKAKVMNMHTGLYYAGPEREEGEPFMNWVMRRRQWSRFQNRDDRIYPFLTAKHLSGEQRQNYAAVGQSGEWGTNY